MGQNLYQIVTCFGFVGFTMYACGFSVSQMQQFYLFTYPPKSKGASSEKMIFFAKIGIFCKLIASPLGEAYTQSYSFGGRIKLIIRQIRHKLSVTIHEISTSCKKETLDDGPYIIQRKNNVFKNQLRNVCICISIGIYVCICIVYCFQDQL